jgi:glycosyltransferase involved in cell wall biosynthesis
MNITILCNSASWGGLEILTTKLALWFLEAKHTITVLCPPNSRAFNFCMENKITAIPFAPKSKYADFRAINFLKKIITNQDILLIPVSKDVNLGVLARKFANKTCKCKLIYIQNMQIGIDKKDFIHTYFYRNLDAWISPLNLLKENTLQRTKIAENKIHVIPFGIETEQFITPKYTQIEARKILQLPENQLIAGIMGRIDPAKGQEFLIKAIAKLKQNGKILHAAIIGEETHGDKRQYLQYLKNLTSELGITELIHFCPFQKDIALAYTALDIFVMTSTNETYGLVTLEAMLAALPVVASFAGGTKELIKDRETGLFFESENAENLAKKLTEILDFPNFRQELGKKAQEESLKTYDYRKQIKAMEKLFLSL